MIDWLSDPLLTTMTPAKKELLMKAALQTSGKSGNALAASLMSIITSAHKKGISFTPDEVSLLLKIMKQGKSEEEQHQIDHMVKTVQSMMTKYKK